MAKCDERRERRYIRQDDPSQRGVPCDQWRGEPHQRWKQRKIRRLADRVVASLRDTYVPETVILRQCRGDICQGVTSPRPLPEDRAGANHYPLTQPRRYRKPPGRATAPHTIEPRLTRRCSRDRSWIEPAHPPPVLPRCPSHMACVRLRLWKVRRAPAKRRNTPRLRYSPGSLMTTPNVLSRPMASGSEKRAFFTLLRVGSMT